MLLFKEVSDRISNKVDTIRKLCSELNKEDRYELKNKLWQLEREAALLREFIDNNSEEEEYKEVI